MVTYKCFECGKAITDKSIEKRFQCPFCNSKIFYKPRKIITKVKAVSLFLYKMNIKKTFKINHNLWLGVSFLDAPKLNGGQ